MAIRDVLVALNTYPDATPAAAIDVAARLAGRLDGRLSAIIHELRLDPPGPIHFLADALLNLPRLIEEATRRSTGQAGELATAFKAAAEGVCRIERCAPVDFAGRVAESGRFHDLTVVPVLAQDDASAVIAEAAIFGSGRPVMVVPQSAFGSPMALETIMIACDYGAPAARAIGDALPLLALARQVQVVTVQNEKPLKATRSAADLWRYLARHGIRFEHRDVDAGGRAVGEVLAAEATGQGADLLVMGAYGHSRLQEFVLGGATNSMVRSPPLPVLMSH